MAQQGHPVFETPDMGGATVGRARPVDLVKLARQTGGDKALEEEVLRLFLRQAKAVGRAVDARCSDEQRKHNAHTLKGAALAIGAGAIADSAMAVERSPQERGCVRALLAEIDRTCDYINSLLR